MNDITNDCVGRAKIYYYADCAEISIEIYGIQKKEGGHRRYSGLEDRD